MIQQEKPIHPVNGFFTYLSDTEFNYGNIPPYPLMAYLPFTIVRHITAFYPKKYPNKVKKE